MASILWWSLLLYKFFILRSFVITIEKVCGTVFGFVQVQRGCRDKTILRRQKRLFSFQNNRFLYFLTKKALWFEERSVLDTTIMRMATSQKQVTNRWFIAAFSHVNVFKIEFETEYNYKDKLKDPWPWKTTY